MAGPGFCATPDATVIWIKCPPGQTGMHAIGPIATAVREAQIKRDARCSDAESLQHVPKNIPDVSRISEPEGLPIHTIKGPKTTYRAY